MTIDMDEIAQIFIEESLEGLDIMESSLLNLDLGAADDETMNTIFRAAHSIKGGGATFGFTEISNFAHHVETLLDEMRQGLRQVTQSNVDILLLSVDCIRNMIADISTGTIDTDRANELQVDLENILGNMNEEPDKDKNSTANPAPETAGNITKSEKLVGWHITFKPFPDILKSCNDPQRIFRELREFGELSTTVNGVESLDFNSMDPEECSLHWELILQSEVSREEVEEVFAWVLDECELILEPMLEEYLETEMVQKEIAPSTAEEAKPDTEATQLKVVKSSSAKSSGGQESGSIRVSIDKVDALINLVGELVIT